MRWKHKLFLFPDSGAVRHRQKFAWKRTIVEMEIVWLEFYGIEEEYFIPDGGGHGWWRTVRTYLGKNPKLKDKR